MLTEVPSHTEHDSLGEVQVPNSAFWGAQTQRAIENFPISGLRMPRAFIRALGLIKSAAAQVNADLGLLDKDIATAIVKAADEVATGMYDDQFPVDVFQTGSGTSTNMNANEVIAHLASQGDKLKIHPNDHVNYGQSSNDVIPACIHLSSAIQLHEQLLPALKTLLAVLEARSEELKNVTKTGRTHLMDAMPITFGQEIGGWAAQVRKNIQHIEASCQFVQQLQLGGTAVGTGINTHPKFASKVCKLLAVKLTMNLSPMENFFAGMSAQDAIVELSGQLRGTAVILTKIANDIRWMNSGPLAGLNEIRLKAIQPGSSIMPGKVNPVIPEAICMVAAQVIGNDATIAFAGQSGNFQLNVMLPVIAYNILQSIEITANAALLFAEKPLRDFVVNQDNIGTQLAKNPVLITALNSIIGYERGAEIVKAAYRDNRAIKEVAKEMTDLTIEQLEELLDPQRLTGEKK